MSVLSAAYGAAVGARNWLYDRGALEPRRLEGPVVSVGNLSVGGAGKTPLVMLLAEALTDRGIACDVLSRGYGRHSRGARIVDPGGLPQDFGDEPLLIARRTGASVVIGEDRHAAGLLAERTFGSCLHLLDDGFQHRALHRDFDIVLVTPEDADDRLLPSGRLREPLAALARADALVLSWGAEAEKFPLAGKTVWQMRRGIEPVEVPPQPVAFCGIARPANFFMQLKLAGIEMAAQAIFPDHHRYSETDVRDLRRLATENEAGGFVTTEKDAVNLGGYLASLAPLGVARVRALLDNLDRALDHLLETVQQRRGGRLL